VSRPGRLQCVAAFDGITQLLFLGDSSVVLSKPLDRRITGISTAAPGPRQPVCGFPSVKHRATYEHMIPLAVPIAFAVLALVAWRYDERARRAYEATLSEAEKRQFRALRRVNPSKWRAAIALKQAGIAATASQAGVSRERKR
jgi:hypothetical protein